MIMKKRRNYIYIAIAIAAVFLAAIIFNIREIRDFYVATLAHMTSPIVIVAAALVGFVFLGKKNYWTVVVVSAIVVSVFVQLIMVGNGFVTTMIFARACAFIAIVYIMNFVKILLNK